MLNKKFVDVLNYSEINKAAHISNPRAHSPKQNKKGISTTGAYFKIPTPVWSKRQKLNLNQ